MKDGEIWKNGRKIAQIFKENKKNKAVVFKFSRENIKFLNILSEDILEYFKDNGFIKTKCSLDVCSVN